MEHKTTAIVIIMDSTDLAAILQEWAAESGFSLYESNAQRTIYSKNILGAKGWVLAEKQENKVKVEAWQSSKGVGPDFEGNFWVGWKMPVPTGLVAGPNGVYKKQVNTLFALLTSKSKSVPVIGNSNLESKPNQILTKGTLATGIALVGAIDILSGLVSLVGANTITRATTFTGFAASVSQNGVHDLILGMLFVICSRLLAEGKTLAIWLYGCGIAMEILFSFSRVSSLNYIALGLGLLFIWQMIRFRREWSLS